MRLTHSLAGLALLWTVLLSVAVNADVYITFKQTRSTVTIQFTQPMFLTLYECLCVGTESCKVKYNTAKKVTNITSSEKTNNTFSCQCYSCSFPNGSFKCTQETSPSCYGSGDYQSVHVNNSPCGSNACVAFFMDNIAKIDYSGSQSMVKECEEDRQCLTTVQRTTSTTKVVPTSVPSTARQPSTTMQQSSVAATATSTGTNSVESTTESNVTVSKHTSSSDDTTDNSGVILGVTLPIVAIIAVVVIVIVVFLRRRKRNFPDKHVTGDHDYVNISKTSKASQNAELKTPPILTQNALNDYSNCAFDNALETYATDNINNSECTDISTNEHNTNLNPECVYSKAGSFEKTAKTDSNEVVSDPSYAHLANTVGDTDDAGEGMYAVASNIGSTSGLHHDQSKVDSPISNPKPNLNEHPPQSRTKGYDSNDDTRIIKGGLIYPETSNGSGYESIGPKVNSHLTSTCHNVKLPNTPHLNFQQADPSITPKAAVLKPPIPQSSTASDHIPNENAEYSFATSPSYPQDSNNESGSSDIYTKLRENTNKIINPYNELLQPNLDDITTRPTLDVSPTRKVVKPSSEGCLTSELGTYSTAKSIQDWPSMPGNYNGVYHDSGKENVNVSGNMSSGDVNCMEGCGIYFELEPE